jgi:hypothetical protein
MKNKFIFLKILLIVAGGMIVMGMAGCENGTTDDPIQPISKYLSISDITLSGNVTVFLLSEPNTPLIAGGFGTINNNNVSIPLHLTTPQGGVSTAQPAWTGTGQYQIGLVHNKASFNEPDYYTSEKIDFSAETTTISWTKFQAWSN